MSVFPHIEVDKVQNEKKLKRFNNTKRRSEISLPVEKTKIHITEADIAVKLEPSLIHEPNVESCDFNVFCSASDRDANIASCNGTPVKMTGKTKTTSTPKSSSYDYDEVIIFVFNGNEFFSRY